MRKLMIILCAFLLTILASTAVSPSGVKAAQNATVSFDRIAHQMPYLEVRLYGDGELLATREIAPQPLAWIYNEFDFELSGDYGVYTLEFAGRVYSGLGQKLDNVSLTIDGCEILTNGNFDNAFSGWDNPDIGIDGVNGGWYWAVPPKMEAKLDGAGSGANAAWGVEYRLSQDAPTCGTQPTPSPTSDPGVTATPTTEPTSTPIGTPVPTATVNPTIPRWCRENPDHPRCEVYYP